MIVLYNSFFAALQPISLLFGAIGLTLLYYTKKYLLLSRYTKPALMDKSLNQSMTALIDFAPFFFSLGSLTVMNFFAG